MKIDINTKMITLLGKPLGQSFAARMQNAGYEAAGLNMLYFYTEVDKDHLGDVVNGLRYMNFAGFAVTKPNKVRVLRYLDELDPLCKKMGASNTVVKTPEGKLIGYNTDGVGFYTSLVEEGKINVEESTFFCFGAGGAGRAMCSVLAYHGAKKIYITDFYEPCAESLVMDINENFAPVAELVHHGDYAKIAECNVVMNASGNGMGSTIGQTPMPVEHIQPGQFYFDACYNPDKTQFLLNAEEKGCQVLNGLGMSLYQGAAQIELWTGEKAPVEAMRKGNMLRVNVLVDLLPTKARNAINIVIDLINTVVMALFFYGSITVIQNALNSGRTSPAMELPMAAVYICLLIGFGLGVLRGIQQIVLHVMNFNKKELTTLEQAMADAAEEAAAAKGDLEGGAN